MALLVLLGAVPWLLLTVVVGGQQVTPLPSPTTFPSETPPEPTRWMLEDLQTSNSISNPPSSAPLPSVLTRSGGRTLSTDIAIKVGVPVGLVGFFICAGLSVWIILSLRRRRKGIARPQKEPEIFDEQPMEEDLEQGPRPLCHMARPQKEQEIFNEQPMEEDFEQGPRRFGYKELAVATRDFSDEEKLGEGGFGSVYRGYLKDMNRHVAIKRFSKTSTQGKKEYASEVKIISRLRHRNLVQLIGWCHDDGELLLVYDLMPNGSLDTHIRNENNILSWPHRHAIVLGVGSALAYLHQDWEQCVLHRDVKPSNILLDMSFNARLGDFGLARLIDHGRVAHTTVLAGTMWYMDPICMVTCKASPESDVYSFGVVVLEIATGQRPVVIILKENEQESTIHLVQWVWELFGDGRILDAADERLDGEFDRQGMERLMVVALWCVHPDSSMRPSIRQALNVMQSEAPLPNLPAKMPVAMFVPPVDGFLTGSSSSSSNSAGTKIRSTFSLLR